MPTTRPADPLAARWTMLSIVSLGFYALGWHGALVLGGALGIGAAGRCGRVPRATRRRHPARGRGARAGGAPGAAPP